MRPSNVTISGPAEANESGRREIRGYRDGPSLVRGRRRPDEGRGRAAIEDLFRLLGSTLTPDDLADMTRMLDSMRASHLSRDRKGYLRIARCAASLLVRYESAAAAPDSGLIDPFLSLVNGGFRRKVERTVSELRRRSREGPLTREKTARLDESASKVGDDEPDSDIEGVGVQSLDERLERRSEEAKERGNLIDLTDIDASEAPMGGIQCTKGERGHQIIDLVTLSDKEQELSVTTTPHCDISEEGTAEIGPLQLRPFVSEIERPALENANIDRTIQDLPQSAKVILCVAIALSQVSPAWEVIRFGTLKRYCHEALCHGLMESFNVADFLKLVLQLIGTRLLSSGTDNALEVLLLHQQDEIDNVQLSLGAQADDLEVALSKLLYLESCVHLRIRCQCLPCKSSWDVAGSKTFYTKMIDYVKRNDCMNEGA